MMCESSGYTTLKSSGVKNVASVVCRETLSMLLLLVALCCLTLSGLTQVVLADEVEANSGRPFKVETYTMDTLTVLQFDIPRQRADGALTALGHQADITVVYRLDWVEPFYTNVLRGDHTLPQAVQILLAGTGLTARFDSKGHLIISQKNDGEKESMNFKQMNSKKKLLAATVGFFIGTGGASHALAEEPQSGEELGWLLEEVIVTASKRGGSETLQNTAISISVLSSEAILNRGLVSAGDYLATIPGVSFTETGARQNKIVIRGLSAGNINTEGTVGSYLGEIPLGTGEFDVKLVDVERVEVLKGPQGTLYGSDAFSGVVRNIPVAPNLQEIDGTIRVNAGSQSESGDLNNSTIGALNIPIIDDQVALRVTGYHFDNAGYVDAVSTPEVEAYAASTGSAVIIEDDIGGSTYSGARATLLWTANAKLDLTLMLGTQEVDVKGSSQYLTTSNYQTSYLNIPHGVNEIIGFDYGSLVVDLDLGWASLMSASSLLRGEADIEFNFYTQAPGGAFGAASNNTSRDRDRFTQEIRLASQLEGAWRYVVGFFYEDYEADRHQVLNWDGSSATNPFVVNPLGSTLEHLKLKQKAIFGEIAYTFNEQWELTFGGRYFDYDRVDSSEQLDSAFNPGGLSIVAVNASENGTTFKTNLSFTPSDKTLFYVQWSEGFRLGKGQVVPPLGLCDTDNNGKLDFTDGDLIGQVDSDRTENFELGAKLIFLDDSLTLNASVFNIDWADLPAAINNTSSVCPGAAKIINNIGEANSKGLEVEVSYLATPQLMVNLSASYVEAEWENTEGINANPGDSLSFAPRTNAQMGVQYDFDLNGYPAFTRVDISYVGEYENSFESQGFGTAGDYVNVSMRLGINVDQWSFALYAKNMTNERAVLSRLRVSENSASPRRLGLEASYSF